MRVLPQRSGLWCQIMIQTLFRIDIIMKIQNQLEKGFEKLELEWLLWYKLIIINVAFVISMTPMIVFVVEG